jgi:hypothetical protein
MEQSPWETNRFKASQEIPRNLWNPKAHYHVHNCLLSQSWARLIQSMPPLPTSWRTILIQSSHLCLGIPSGLFPSGFPTKILHTPLLYVYSVSVQICRLMFGCLFAYLCVCMCVCVCVCVYLCVSATLSCTSLRVTHRVEYPLYS